MDFQWYVAIKADGIAGVETISLLVEAWKKAQEPLQYADELVLDGLIIGINGCYQQHENHDEELRC